MGSKTLLRFEDSSIQYYRSARQAPSSPTLRLPSPVTSLPKTKLCCLIQGRERRREKPPYRTRWYEFVFQRELLPSRGKKAQNRGGTFLRFKKGPSGRNHDSRPNFQTNTFNGGIPHGTSVEVTPNQTERCRKTTGKQFTRSRIEGNLYKDCYPRNETTTITEVARLREEGGRRASTNCLVRGHQTRTGNANQ